MANVIAGPDLFGKTCPYCQTPIEPGVEACVCDACGIPHHAECWSANRGCTTIGCGSAPGSVVSPLNGIQPQDGQASICPICGHMMNASDGLCPQCEEQRSLGIVPGQLVDGGRTAQPILHETSGPLFLHIPVSRLIILSIVTSGLYDAYWLYKNWRYIKERDGLNITPFWRGIFGIFFVSALLRRIHEDRESRAFHAPAFSPGGLALGFIVLTILSNLISRMPSLTASIVAAFIPSFLCLVPAQNYVNAVSEKRNPNEPYYGWSSGHVVCLVIGIIMWLMVLIGTYVELMG